MSARIGRGTARTTVSNPVDLTGRSNKKRPVLSSFTRKSSAAAKPCSSSSRGADGDAGLGLTSDGGPTPALTTKADKLGASASEKCKKPGKKWPKWLSLRKKKCADAAGVSRRLGPFIENRNWETVREILQCGESIGNCSKELISADQDEDEEPMKSKGSRYQQASAALDQLNDYSGQNALHHMCRFQPPVDVISHAIHIHSNLPVGLDCLERMPLHIAAGWGSHPEVIVKLLKASQHHVASLEISSESESNASDKFQKVLSRCLQSVAGKPDTHGKTPLHFAAENLSVQVSRTYGKFGPAFASAANNESAEHSLRVLKILADACPEAIIRKDDDGMTPSDYVLRGGGFGRHCLREGVTEDEVRRKAVRYLLRARGRKARLRSALNSRQKQSSQKVDNDNCEVSFSSSDSSPLPKAVKKSHFLKETDSPGSEENRLSSAARGEVKQREDDILAARLLELMGCSAEDTKAVKRDDASIERMRQIISSHNNNQKPCPRDAPRRRNHNNKSGAPPVDSIDIPQGFDIHDDISVITPPKNVSGWNEDKPTVDNESEDEITENI